MSLFEKLTTTGLEAATDSLGGRPVLDTDIYDGTIKAAYVITSAGGAMGITLIAQLGNTEYQETVYITDKTGKNYYVSQGDPAKKNPLPGFTLINDLCLIATGAPLSEQAHDTKVVKKYDSDAKKELPTEVPMLIDLLDTDITFAIRKQISDKMKKEGDEYVSTGETREENVIEKVFHPTMHITVSEATKEVTEPVFYTAWLEKNKGTVKDKTSKDKSGGKVGTTAPKTERKSLFGKK